MKGIRKTEQRCLNCGKKLTNKYCSYCGQSANVRRLTFNSMIKNGFYEITSADHGVIYTLKILFTKPGKIITDYIDGRRANYARPFNLLIIMCTIYGLLSWLGYSFLGQADIIRERGNMVVNTIIEESIFAKFFNNNMVVWNLLILPLGAVITKFVFKNKRYPRYNFTEFFYICLFIGCQAIVVDIVVKILLIISQIMFDYIVDIERITIIAYFCLASWSLKEVFKISWGLAVWKSLQRQLLVMLCILTIMSVSVLIK